MSRDASPVVLYMHIPKAAGTTVSGVLFHCLKRPGAQCAEHGHLISGVYYYPSGFVAAMGATSGQEVQRVLARNDLAAVLGHFHFGIHEAIPVRSTYLTILRPPVERFTSLFYFHKLVQSRWGKLEGAVLPENMDLEAFARAAPYKELDNGQTRRISGCDPDIGGCTPAMLARAKQNLREYFSVVGTTERLEETLVLMQKRFRWPQELRYYPQNVNPARPSTDVASVSARDAIVSRNVLDLELYCFADELLDRAIRSAGEGFQKDVNKLKECNARLADTGSGRPTR